MTFNKTSRWSCNMSLRYNRGLGWWQFVERMSLKKLLLEERTILCALKSLNHPKSFITVKEIKTRCIFFSFRRKMSFCFLWLSAATAWIQVWKPYLCCQLAHFTTSKQVFMLKLWVLGAAQLYFSCRAGVLTSLPGWALTCLASQSVNTRVTYTEVLAPEYKESAKC